MAHFLRITAHTSLGGSNTAVNTWHFSADGIAAWPTTGAGVVTQANLAIGWLKDLYDDVATAGLAFAWTIGDVVTEHESGQPTSFVAATPQTSVLVGGSLCAYQLAGVVSWKTGLAGRSFRGRTYFGPLKTSAFTFPDLSNAWPGAVNTAVANFLNAPGAGDLVPCVYSTVRDETHKITSGLTSQACRTMRSRAS